MSSGLWYGNCCAHQRTLSKTFDRRAPAFRGSRETHHTRPWNPPMFGGVIGGFYMSSTSIANEHGMLRIAIGAAPVLIRGRRLGLTAVLHRYAVLYSVDFLNVAVSHRPAAGQFITGFVPENSLTKARDFTRHFGHARAALQAALPCRHNAHASGLNPLTAKTGVPFSTSPARGGPRAVRSLFDLLLFRTQFPRHGGCAENYRLSR